MRPEGARSHLDAIPLGQVSQKDRVAGGEAPPAKPGMRHEKTVERIARPAQIEGPGEPQGGRGIVEDPGPVFGDLLQARATKPDPAGFDQELKLQQVRR